MSDRPVNNDLNSLAAENSRLLQDLQLRNQLIQQLSQEIFRLIKGNVNLNLQEENGENQEENMLRIKQELQHSEKQVKFYQEQIIVREQKIGQLQQSVETLTDRNQMLEKMVEELPEVYRQKFSERLVPIQERLKSLEQENRQLYSELQSVTYRLAVRSRGKSQIDLPQFEQQKSSSSIPTFGNV